MRLLLGEALHARPANLFVRVASQFAASSTVTFGGKTVSAKSILDVLALGAAQGATIELAAHGADADAALDALRALVEANFNADLVPETGSAAVEGIAVGPAVLFVSPAESGVDLDPVIRFRRAREGLRELMARLPVAERELFEPELPILDELEVRVLQRMKDGSGFADAVLEATTGGRTDLLHDARVRLLSDGASTLALQTEPCILIAAELPPSLVATLPPSVVGILSARAQGEGALPQRGTGDTSHAAILARSRGIPLAFVGDEILSQIDDGDLVVLDTTESPARVWLSPSEALLRDARARRESLAREQTQRTAQASALAQHLSTSLRVNVSHPDEPIPEHARGVGLVRTELVFAAHPTEPTVSQQAAVYTKLVRAAAGHPVTIRLFDAGGDKPLQFLGGATAQERGAALLLCHEPLLRRQLMAISEAAAQGPARALIPLCRDARDVERVRELGPPGLSVGAMIETREAVACIDEIAATADFLSIGTNDLTASVLGENRAATERGLEPAVREAIERVVASAHRHGREITVCGELSAHEEGSRWLVGIGVNALSVAVPSFYRVALLLSDTKKRGPS